jgi:hypothetical protein
MALDASDKLGQATVEAEWGHTEKSDELLKAADDIFAGVRTLLLSDAESERVVELYVRLRNNYLEYRVRLQEQEESRKAVYPAVPELRTVRIQRDVVLGLAKELRKTIQVALKSLEP